ncbi:unnamed protein product, partial [Caretta caretta]
ICIEKQGRTIRPQFKIGFTLTVKPCGWRSHPNKTALTIHMERKKCPKENEKVSQMLC